MNPNFWRERSVFITGHSGFKGGWLSLWLYALGARLHGYALDPDVEPSLCTAVDISKLFRSDVRADIADFEQLRVALEYSEPEVIFHLAAQPLVRTGYRNPLVTFSTNVMGTAGLLEAARGIDSVKAIVVVTTDKVYANDESGRGFIEEDQLGGLDPYSASKAAAELVAASYRASFFKTEGSARVATARAGNVIGGGDWARDRLIPDCFRAFERGEKVILRYPHSVRPWQHVLEPLSGYLSLAEKLSTADGASYAEAWNFGPDAADTATVGSVAKRLAILWGGGASVDPSPDQEVAHEASLLNLNSSKARSRLAWGPRWTLDRSLAATVQWQRSWFAGGDIRAVCDAQIASYCSGCKSE